MEIVKVIRSGDYTIVFWDDNVKTVVKRASGDADDFEAAISAAVFKRAVGNSRQKVTLFLGETLEKTVRLKQKPKKAKLVEVEEVPVEVENETSKRHSKRIDRGKMMALFEAGWTTKNVSIEFGVSEPTIRKVFQDHTGQSLAQWRRAHIRSLFV